jgi:MFS family permease
MARTFMTAEPGLTRPLRETPFLLYLLGSFLLNFVMWMHIVTSSWWMISTHQPARNIAMIPLCLTAPGILLSIVSGVLSDRLGWRRIYLTAVALFFIAPASVFVLYSVSLLTLPLLISMTLLLGCASSLRQPPLQSSFAILVPPERLLRAISLESLSLNLGRAVGPALAGGFIELGGLKLGMAGICLFALTGAAISYAILRRVELPIVTFQQGSLWPVLIDGARYCLFHPVLRFVCILAFLFGALGQGLWVLVPTMFAVRQVESSASLGFVLGFIGAGAIVGAALRVKLNSILSSEKLLPYAVACAIAAPLSLSIDAPLYVISAGLFGLGVAWTTVYSTAPYLVQTTAAPEMKGRAFSYYFAAAFLGWAFGSGFWGASAAFLGIARSAQLEVIFFTGLVVWLCINARTLRDPASGDQALTRS